MFAFSDLPLADLGIADIVLFADVACCPVDNEQPY
jgi:hypothetical protein